MLEGIATGDRFALLESFVRIVEAGSISTAAIQMGTTQPTLSRRLQSLEQALKLHLVIRNAHRFKLTEDGERCYERAKELLAAWDSFESDLRSSQAQVKGNLRILAPHAFGQHQLVLLLADFLKLNPELTVDWSLRDHLEDFAAQGFDCAIKVGEAPEGNVIAEKVGEVPRIVVAAPSLLAEREIDVEKAKDLTSLPWLALSTFYRHSIVLTHRESSATEKLILNPRMSTDSLYAIRTAAVEGLGVCVASAWLLADDIAVGRLVHLLPEWEAESLPVYLIYPAAPYYPMRLKKFVQAMREAVPISLQFLRDHH